MNEEADLDNVMMDVLTGDKSIEDALNLVASSTPAEDEATTVPPTQDGNEPTKAEGEPAKADDPKGDEATDPVVLAKDGEHTLPFSVVEGLRAQVTELSSKLEEATRTGNTEELAAAPEFSQEDLDLVKEEMPELAEAMTKLVDERKGLVEKINDLQTKVVDTEAVTQKEAGATAQETIDSIPKLAHIQATDPELFAKAVEVDKELTGRPEYDSLTQAEQFQKSLSVVEAMYGDVVVPGANKVAETPPKDAKPEPKALPDKVDTPIPNSLSDLPAGSPPEHDPLAALTSQSSASITGHFANKTPDQIEAMVNQLI